MKFKIAVVQFRIEQFSPEANLRKAEEYIKKAGGAGANVIIFPEDFITGPIFGEKIFVDFKNKYMKIFRKWAKKYSIDIVAGSIIEGNKRGWFNTAYYIDAKGEVLGKYRKINLWHPEREYLSAGNKIITFETKYGKAGLVICWDIMFPDIFKAMIKKGVKIIYCPSYWALEDAGEGLKYNKNSEIELIDAVSIARAFENEIIFVYANPAGDKNTGGFALMGRSQITVPFKGALKKLEHNREEMFIQEVDTGILDDAEAVYKIHSDLRDR